MDFEAQVAAMIDAKPQVISSIMGVYPPHLVKRMKDNEIRRAMSDFGECLGCRRFFFWDFLDGVSPEKASGKRLHMENHHVLWVNPLFRLGHFK